VQDAKQRCFGCVVVRGRYGEVRPMKINVYTPFPLPSQAMDLPFDLRSPSWLPVDQPMPKGDAAMNQEAQPSCTYNLLCAAPAEEEKKE